MLRIISKNSHDTPRTNQQIGRGEMSPSYMILLKKLTRFDYLMAFLFCLLAGGILAVYWFQPLYQVIPVPVYLTFHTILEFLSVVISSAVFIVTWYNFQQTGNRRELIICLTFLAVGIIDFAHALSYNGMPEFFTPNSENKASTYWIAGCLVQAFGITAAVFIKPGSGKKVNPVGYAIFTVFFISASLFFIAVEPGFLPHMYLDGYGQTTIKIVLEIVVILVQVFALAYMMVRKKVYFSDRYLEAALLFCVFSEVAFTLYSSAYDTYNLIGHIYKICAFIAILRGFFMASIVRLYESNKVLAEKQKDLAEINAQLQKVNQLKSDFIATTNHELRTPLTAIIAFIELLLDEQTGPLNEVQKDYLLEINEGSQKLLVEINNLLDLSKVEAGRMKVYLERTPVQDIVSQVFRQLNPIFMKKHQHVSASFAPDLPDIPMDREKVKKILVNLLSNAHKFTPESGVIQLKIDMSEDGQWVKITVSDNGIGLRRNQIATIFDKFFQVDESLNHEHHGTGLGLTMVKYFVELHGGRVWVVSEPGQGSTFTFTLPLGVPSREAI